MTQGWPGPNGPGRVATRGSPEPSAAIELGAEAGRQNKNTKNISVLRVFELSVFEKLTSTAQSPPAESLCACLQGRRRCTRGVRRCCCRTCRCGLRKPGCRCA